MRDALLVIVTVTATLGLSVVLLLGGALYWLVKEMDEEHRHGGRR